MSRSLRDVRHILAANPSRSQAVEDYATELQHILYKTLFPRSTGDQAPPPAQVATPPVEVVPPDIAIQQNLLSFIQDGLQQGPLSVNHDDIEFARSRMHKSSAAGPDGIEPSLLHSLKDELLRWDPTTTLQDALSYNSGRQVRLVQVPKPGGGSRPIAVINAVKRFASAIVTSSLTRTLPKRAFQYQEGFVTGGSPWRHILAIDSIRLTHPNKSVLFLDFAGAYDSVRRSYLRQVLDAWGGPPLVGLVDTVLHGLAPEGVPQGLPLSPLLFILALHPILQLIKQRAPNIAIYAYADDIALVGDVHDLTTALATLAAVSNTTGLVLNKAKCGVIGPAVLPDIPSVTAYKYLGVMITDPPSWSHTVKTEKIKDARNRISGASIVARAPSFNTALRSLLNYTAPVRSLANSAEVESELYAKLMAGLELIPRDTLRSPSPTGLGLLSPTDVALLQAAVLLRSLLSRPLPEFDEYLGSVTPGVCLLNLPTAIKFDAIGPRMAPMPFVKLVIALLRPPAAPPSVVSVTIDHAVPTTAADWEQQLVLFNPLLLWTSRFTSGPFKARWIAESGLRTVAALRRARAGGRLSGGHLSVATTIINMVDALKQTLRPTHQPPNTPLRHINTENDKEQSTITSSSSKLSPSPLPIDPLLLIHSPSCPAQQPTLPF
jgi:hypothetical protein